jgi:hypothetical protein
VPGKEPAGHQASAQENATISIDMYLQGAFRKLWLHPSDASILYKQGGPELTGMPSMTRGLGYGRASRQRRASMTSSDVSASMERRHGWVPSEVHGLPKCQRASSVSILILTGTSSVALQVQCQSSRPQPSVCSCGNGEGPHVPGQQAGMKVLSLVEH